MLLGRTGRWQEAENHILKVLKKEPSRGEALYWQALVHKNGGDPQGAAKLCETILGADPRNPIVQNELGLCLMTMNDAKRALTAFDVAARVDPGRGVYHFNLGLALSKLDRIYKARDAFREAIRLEPSRVEAYLELVRILEILDARNEVVEVLNLASKFHPANFQIQTALAAANAYVGNRKLAEQIYGQVSDAFPIAGNSFGLWLQQEGRFKESITCFQKSLQAVPQQGVAYYGLAEAKSFELDGLSWIPAAEELVDSDDLDLKGQTYLCYALARAFEKERDYEKTIQYFHLANAKAFQLYNEGRPYDRREIEALATESKAKFTKDFLGTSIQGASDSRKPIFIVGMIRSGTTLLDQILSSHPEVKSAGEPVFWLREADKVRRLRDIRSQESYQKELANNYLQVLDSVDSSARHITDKMPLNYAHLGLIHQVFPNAKIIHLRRQPLDTCFSIYTTFLGQGPNFAYNASNIVFNYRQYLDLMAHWRQVLPKSVFMEVNYEDIVADKEAHARELIRYCDLEWSDSCLQHEHNDSSIRTPSKWQARQPVYKTSLQKWKPYEKWLGDLLDVQDLH